jgi:hypothetical protein
MDIDSRWRGGPTGGGIFHCHPDTSPILRGADDFDLLLLESRTFDGGRTQEIAD